MFPNNLFKPWVNNKLTSRDDVMQALRDLAEPVERYRSDGGARIRLGTVGAHFDQQAADMEGFSRLLWGLAPAQVGGADWIDWSVIRAGLINGCDPEHAEYWGDINDNDQRLVELAAIGLALRLVPDQLWHPLDRLERNKVAAYLKAGHAANFVNNNWQFFRLLISLGLRHVGEVIDSSLDEASISAIDEFYLGDGWYRDGVTTRADHYIPFAFHFYGPILAALDNFSDHDAYLARAEAIRGDMSYWFADDGAPLCFGRSMTYRFAIGGYWGALAVASKERSDWGKLKGFYLRHLRWWSNLPFAGRDSIMDIGYGYSNLMMSEPYNSPQSPYWALKAFLPLMLSEDHPFWSSQEEAPEDYEKVKSQPEIGFLISKPFGQTIALSSGQYTEPDNRFIHAGPEKYAKFAYSSHYGFCVENDGQRFSEAIVDNMLALSDDGNSYRVRSKIVHASISDGISYSLWCPYEDVSVESWLYWDQECHVRTHLIKSSRELDTKEGGFAAPHGRNSRVLVRNRRAYFETGEDISLIIDLSPQILREGNVFTAAPNTNLLHPKVRVPQLLGKVEKGGTVLQCAVFVGPVNVRTVESVEPLQIRPKSLDELRAAVQASAQKVGLL